MGMKIKVLGIDPALRNCGFVSANLDLDTMKLSDIDMQLVETNTTKDKKLRKNSDDLARAREIYKVMQERTKDVVVTFVEVPHGSQSARSMASYGICIGLLASVQSLSFVQLSEQQLKLAILGKKSATKQEMIDWATSMHPEANWLKRSGRYVQKNEHLADAMAAIYAGLLTEDFKNAVAVMRYASAANL